MKKDVYIPAYYTAFNCIADRCRHSCCIDWEIDIDDKTYALYRRIPAILDTVTACEGGACFSLGEDGRCPHLDERGLCRIILTHGEDYLSDICRNHPRFFNDVGGGRIEVGLGIVCEEACRLILENEAPFSLAKADESLGESLPNPDADKDDATVFDPLPQRDEIIARIEAYRGRYDEALASLQDAFALPACDISGEWMEHFLELEILDADWEVALRSAQGIPAQSSPAEHETYGVFFSRLLTYFVYRHVSVAESPDNLRARLAFALLSVDLIRFLFDRADVRTVDTLADLARRYSAEIEYSEENTAELIFAWECRL